MSTWQKYYFKRCWYNICCFFVKIYQSLPDRKDLFHMSNLGITLNCRWNAYLLIKENMKESNLESVLGLSQTSSLP